jgi:acyl-CoA synthetase (AMP-forming)/AMP-acid ligase II
VQTAYDLVWLAAERTPGHLALVDDRSDRALSYCELIAEVDVLAAGLAARGVGPGTRIATALPNLFEHCLVLLALQRLGTVPALLNFRLTPDDIIRLIAQGEMAGAVIIADAPLAEAVKAALPEDGLLLCVGEATGPAESFAACRGDAAGLPPVPRPDPEDEAFIFYTSGTIGLPKGVVVSHRTSLHRVVWLSTQAGLRHGTHNRALGTVPLSHAIGFYGVFLVTLAFNGTYYVHTAFNPVEAVDLIERHRITYLFSIPQLYFALTMAPNYAPERMASLELVLYGGAAIQPALLDRLEAEWPATIRHIYGTTETMCSLYNPEPVGAPARLRPGFYSRVRVVRLGGGVDDAVAAGEEGELIVDATTEQIFSRYLNRPEETAEKLRDGWYFTGDVCLQRGDGDVELLGRVDDLIRSGGENVHPEEVEAVLAAHPAVREAAVVSVPDSQWGEMVVACVVPTETPPNAAALDVHFRKSPLARFKRPKGYLILDALPRNAANKVLRRQLRETAAEARKGQSEIAFHEVG